MEWLFETLVREARDVEPSIVARTPSTFAPAPGLREQAYNDPCGEVCWDDLRPPEDVDVWEADGASTLSLFDIESAEADEEPSVPVNATIQPTSQPEASEAPGGGFARQLLEVKRLTDAAPPAVDARGSTPHTERERQDAAEPDPTLRVETVAPYAPPSPADRSIPPPNQPKDSMRWPDLVASHVTAHLLEPRGVVADLSRVAPQAGVGGSPQDEGDATMRKAPVELDDSSEPPQSRLRSAGLSRPRSEPNWPDTSEFPLPGSIVASASPSWGGGGVAESPVSATHRAVPEGDDSSAFQSTESTESISRILVSAKSEANRPDAKPVSGPGSEFAQSDWSALRSAARADGDDSAAFQPIEPTGSTSPIPVSAKSEVIRPDAMPVSDPGSAIARGDRSAPRSAVPDESTEPTESISPISVSAQSEVIRPDAMPVSDPGSAIARGDRSAPRSAVPDESIEPTESTLPIPVSARSEIKRSDAMPVSGPGSAIAQSDPSAPQSAVPDSRDSSAFQPTESTESISPILVSAKSETKLPDAMPVSIPGSAIARRDRFALRIAVPAERDDSFAFQPTKSTSPIPVSAKDEAKRPDAGAIAVSDPISANTTRLSRAGAVTEDAVTVTVAGAPVGAVSAPDRLALPIPPNARREANRPDSDARLPPASATAISGRQLRAGGEAGDIAPLTQREAGLEASSSLPELDRPPQLAPSGVAGTLRPPDVSESTHDLDRLPRTLVESPRFTIEAGSAPVPSQGKPEFSRSSATFLALADADLPLVTSSEAPMPAVDLPSNYTRLELPVEINEDFAVSAPGPKPILRNDADVGESNRATTPAASARRNRFHVDTTATSPPLDRAHSTRLALQATPSAPVETERDGASWADLRETPMPGFAVRAESFVLSTETDLRGPQTALASGRADEESMLELVRSAPPLVAPVAGLATRAQNWPAPTVRRGDKTENEPSPVWRPTSDGSDRPYANVTAARRLANRAESAGLDVPTAVEIGPGPRTTAARDAANWNQFVNREDSESELSRKSIPAFTDSTVSAHLAGDTVVEKIIQSPMPIFASLPVTSAPNGENAPDSDLNRTMPVSAKVKTAAPFARLAVDEGVHAFKVEISPTTAQAFVAVDERSHIPWGSAESELSPTPAPIFASRPATSTPVSESAQPVTAKLKAAAPSARLAVDAVDESGHNPRSSAKPELSRTPTPAFADSAAAIAVASGRPALWTTPPSAVPGPPNSPNHGAHVAAAVASGIPGPGPAPAEFDPPLPATPPALVPARLTPVVSDAVSQIHSATAVRSEAVTPRAMENEDPVVRIRIGSIRIDGPAPETPRNKVRRAAPSFSHRAYREHLRGGGR